MFSSIGKVGNYALLFSILLADCPLLTVATGTETSSPLPLPTDISWESKIDSFREFILQQPDQNATKGFGYGPGFQQKFPDGQCLQIRFYNWDCFHDIPYKMRGVLKWFDSTSARTEPITDPYRYYTYGYYVDPEDGWNFYNAARLSFGGCGNRGPQSSCGVTWCVDKNGTTPKDVPPGQTPYLDPNNKDNLCPWLKEGSF